jgi:mannose-6-phosphate isomerase-like protein (cupin superfamily)
MSATLARDARSGIRLSVAEVEKTLPPSGIRSVAAFQHGTLLAKLYAPRGHDPQKPHTRDEVYVVASGSGTFVAGDKRHEFGPGDFLFVPAHVVHRFEAFSDDLALWVVFYGPEGGEAA